MSAPDTKKSRKKDAAAKSADGTHTTTGKPRHRRSRMAFWIPLAIFLVLLGFAPSLASRTPLGTWAAAKFVPLNGTLEVGWLSIGWWSPVGAGDIVLRDAEGNVVAEVPNLQTEKSLLALALNHSKLGLLTVDHPQLHLVLREDGSNLEDVLAPLLAQKSQGTQPIVAALKITDGKATVDDRVGRRKYEINDVATDLAWDGTKTAPLNLQAGAKLVDGARTSTLATTLESQPAAGDNPLGAGHLTCQIEGLPLDIVQPLVRRRLAGAQLAGWLSAQLECTWGGGQNHDETSVQGQIDATDLLFSAAALGEDRLELARLSAPCQISGAGDELRIDKLLVDCDLGKLNIRGQARLSDFAKGDLAVALTREACQASGQLDLVRLAALFPHTLHIRPGTQITAGELNIALASQPQESGASLSGRIDTSDLEAVSDGEKFAWQQPLAIEFQARDTGRDVVVDKFSCTSSFLRVDGSGTLDHFTADGNFDLGQLAQELARFADLRGLELSGTGQAQLACQRTDDGHVHVEGEAKATNFALVAANLRPWREPSVVVTLDAVGVVGSGALQKIESAVARLEAGDERLSVQLTGAVSDPLKSIWPVQIDWQGELATLLPRVEPFLTMAGWNVAGWELAGHGSLQATGEYAVDGVKIDQSKLDIEKLHVWGHGLFLDEPIVELSATGSWQRDGNKISLPLASLKGNTLIARVNNLEMSSPAKTGPQAAGDGTLQTDLATLARWTRDPRTAPTRKVSGQLSGKFEVVYGEGVSHAAFNTTIDELEIIEQRAPAPRPTALFQPAASTVANTTWREPRVTLAARLDYDPARDELQITKAELAAEAATAEVAGKISQISKTPDFDISGQLQCDWEQTAPLWRPYVGDAVQITGKDPWPFSLRGPWTPDTQPVLAGVQRMNGAATIKWLSANAYGLTINNGSLDALLKDGTLTFQPIDVEVSGGRVTTAPTIRLATQPAFIELPAGPLASNVQLTPEICSRALKFVAPVFTEVTRTEGQFSIKLQGGKLPLADPLKGDLSGQLIIDEVQVQPGPILQELLGVVQQLEGILEGKVPLVNPVRPVALVKMENETVDFRLQDGRVYHRGLQFRVGNLTITTRGSVGLDQSLSLLAEIPLNRSLVGGNPKYASLSNKTLQIPIEGTLKNWKVDPRAITQLIPMAAGGALLDQLEGGLEKLLPGQR